MADAQGRFWERGDDRSCQWSLSLWESGNSGFASTAKDILVCVASPKFMACPTPSFTTGSTAGAIPPAVTRRSYRQTFSPCFAGFNGSLRRHPSPDPPRTRKPAGRPVPVRVSAVTPTLHRSHPWAASSATHPEWSRYRLSNELCSRWNWGTERGERKDRAARTQLCKLHERGWVRLPPPRIASPNRQRLTPPPPPGWDNSPISGSLRSPGRMRIKEVSGRLEARAEVGSTLASLHYLGYRATVGAVYGLGEGVTNCSVNTLL